MVEHERNCRCLYSMGLARAIIDIPILLVFIQLAILCETSLPVFGFLSSGRIPLIISSRDNVRRCCSTLWNASKSNICGESGQIPTVMNPMSKRKIRLGGPKYTELIQQGGWVQHKGTLQHIDTAMLGQYQQDFSNRHKITIPPFEDSTNVEDELYFITPQKLTMGIETPLPDANNNNDSNVLGASPLKIALDERTREQLQRSLLFVNKPSHLHCVPSRSGSDSLATQVLALHQDSKPCHRLDRDTSGIVLFGLTKDAHRDVSMQFEARTTSKTYVALVAGQPEKDYGIVNLPIGKEKTKEGFNRWVIGGDKPRESITHWNVDHVFTDSETGAVFSRVNLKPLTGRGHQLRLHMKAIGCPILGDTIHGDGGVAMCSPRLCLHAQKLQIDWKDLRLEAESVSPF